MNIALIAILPFYQNNINKETIMPQLIADRRDIDFVLFEQLDAHKLCRQEIYGEFNRKTIEMIVSEARSLAINEILPTLSEGDRQGLSFDAGKVKVPDCFHKPFKLMGEGGWVAMASPEDYGGQGMPSMVGQAASDYLMGANYAFTLYAWAAFGAGEMLEHYGTEPQKLLYLEKLYSGVWGGTMAMTESEAGSDVGNLSTSAGKNADGTYNITGNKIFITCGEQDLTENIIHMVLARIEGAPAGSKGISLFIVPKIWVNEDGSPGEFNDVVCTGIEEKMGIHASSTCSLSFGSSGKCRGVLLGEEHKGLKVMFHMMNAARLAVGSIGFTSGSAAYIHALNYARERVQGTEITQAMELSPVRVPIIRHPDVRRMLMWMKSHVEAMRSLMYFGAFCLDMEKCGNDEEKTYYKGLLDLLTPIIKSYCTDRGFDICSKALQVFGGYGYTREYPVEQLLRDVRIASIYEGTNGIQAMDLLGRKLGMKGGKIFMDLVGEINKTIAQAREVPSLSLLAESLDQTVSRMTEVAMFMGETVMSGKVREAFINAKPFLDIMGDVIAGWMLLWRAVTADKQLEEILKGIEGQKRRQKLEKNKNAAFYAGQSYSAEYFIRNVLPQTAGRMEAVMAGDATAAVMPDSAFGAF